MSVDCSFGLGYLPVMWSVFTLLAFLTSYTMSVVVGHVYPILPSISDTGMKIPEANVFSLLMNVSIILALANYSTRYFQCQHQARHCGESRELIYKYNHISLILALTSILGGLIVANVQSKKEHYLLEVHDSGAIVMFVCSTIYFWVQSYLGYKIALYGLYSRWLCHFRLVITILMTLSSILYLVTSIISYELFVKNNHHHSTSLWQPRDGGYELHVLSNSAEWASFGFLIILALTYFDEFQQVILLIDAQEKSPTIISYDGIGHYNEELDFENNN